MAPGVVVASADSKETSYFYLSDGTTDTFSYNSCKIRRSGSIVAMGAGFVRANEFNSLDYIRDSHLPGEGLRDMAIRLLRDLPPRLVPALEAARKAGDGDLRKALAETSALQIALIGVQDGAPTVEVLDFKAVASATGRMEIKATKQRCPGDCPGGRGAYFLGAHEAIDKAIESNPSLAGGATLARAAELMNLEYVSRPDIVGGTSNTAAG